MRGWASAALLLLCLAGGGKASAEQLTIALSTPDIRIDSSFTGVAVTVFGVIGRDTALPQPAGGYRIAVLMEGPRETTVARRKDRFLGIWANGASESIVAPSFYAVRSSGPLTTVAGPSERQQLDLGLDDLGLSYSGTTPFRDAFLRLKQEDGLYSEDDSLEFIGDSIFRTSVWVPANVPVGRYSVSAYLFSGGGLLAHATDSVLVSKTGFERFMFQASRNQSLAYGLATVALALFSGWLAGVIFRRD